MSDEITQQGILVGVDGSVHSDAAVEFAVREAVMRNVELSIVHVVSPIIGGYSGIGMSVAPLPEDIGLQMEDEARQIVDDAVRLARESAAGAALQVRAETPFSPVASALIDMSKQVQLVVVGSRGRDAWQRALLGSVSTALVHHAHCPVAVVHGRVSPEHAHAPVVVGIDGSPASERATELAFNEASLRGVDLVALHAWSDSVLPGIDSIPIAAIRAEAEETLAERLAGFQERYPDVAVRRLLVTDSPSRNLLAESESAQLLVVGSHGRGGFAGMLLGSVSSKVVHEAHTAVIVARQD